MRLTIELDDSTIAALADAIAGRLARTAVPAPEQPERQYLTVREFAERLHVCERTVWDWVAKGLPCVRNGRLTRVDATRADEWLRTSPVTRAAQAAARRAALKALPGGRP